MNAESGGGLPLYRLIEDESQQVILTAFDIQGFFVDPERAHSHVRVLGVPTGLMPQPARLHDVELQVLDVRGEVLGAYYVGRAEILGLTGSKLVDRVDLDVSFQGYSCPFPYAGEIWRCWASRTPRVLGEWRRLPPDWHQSWLHVVQASWFQAGRGATRYGSEKSYDMDGSGILNTASLYCEIGEAVNGPVGYFGSGLDALADCLRAAVSIGPFELVWRNFSLAEERLGKSEIQSVVSVFREFGVQVLSDARM